MNVHVELGESAARKCCFEIEPRSSSSRREIGIPESAIVAESAIDALWKHQARTWKISLKMLLKHWIIFEQQPNMSERLH